MTIPRTYPTPQELAADPFPYEFLPREGGLYRFRPLNNPSGKVLALDPSDMQPDRLDLRFTHSAAWLRRHFPAPRNVQWPDGEIEAAPPGIDWKRFSLWLRDQSRRLDRADDAPAALADTDPVATAPDGTGDGIASGMDEPAAPVVDVRLNEWVPTAHGLRRISTRSEDLEFLRIPAGTLARVWAGDKLVWEALLSPDQALHVANRILDTWSAYDPEAQVAAEVRP